MLNFPICIPVPVVRDAFILMTREKWVQGCDMKKSNKENHTC
jgi:hypothetical protein